MAILKKRFEGAMDEVELFVDRVAEERRDGEIRVKKPEGRPMREASGKPRIAQDVHHCHRRGFYLVR